MRNNPLIVLLLIIVAIQAAILGSRVFSPTSQKVEGLAGASKSSGVKIERIPGSDLKRLILSPKAAQRLDIQTAEVREQQIMRQRTVPGEVARLSPATIVITAPSAGRVAPLASGTMAGPGTRLMAGAP